MKLAFTLIELLVVIAIIAILAAILFPVFVQAKQAEKKSATTVAALIYSSDSDDYEQTNQFPLGTESAIKNVCYQNDLLSKLLGEKEKDPGNIPGKIPHHGKIHKDSGVPSSGQGFFELWPAEVIKWKNKSLDTFSPSTPRSLATWPNWSLTEPHPRSQTSLSRASFDTWDPPGLQVKESQIAQFMSLKEVAKHRQFMSIYEKSGTKKLSEDVTKRNQSFLQSDTLWKNACWLTLLGVNGIGFFALSPTQRRPAKKSLNKSQIGRQSLVCRKTNLFLSPLVNQGQTAFMRNAMQWSLAAKDAQNQRQAQLVKFYDSLPDQINERLDLDPDFILTVESHNCSGYVIEGSLLCGLDVRYDVLCINHKESFVVVGAFYSWREPGNEIGYWYPMMANGFNGEVISDSTESRRRQLVSYFESSE